MSRNLININKWLYPASWIYGAGVWLRNKLFDWGYYKERSFNLPVICIGNLTVGGTGKTPHTEYLIQLLHKSYQVAVLSRGYKRKSKGFVLAKADTPVRKIGDEPYQMKQKFPDIHMAVVADRCNGIEQLCKANVTPATDVILLDDAFQHRHVKAEGTLCHPSGNGPESEKSQFLSTNIIAVLRFYIAFFDFFF